MALEILFIDGVHSHDTWPETGRLVRRALERSGRFSLTHVTEPEPERFRADFSKFDVVIPYYCPVPSAERDPLWPAETRAALEAYVAKGGGLVIVHAASNAFASWPAYNRMIGLGGWGGRGEEAGTYLYVDAQGNPVRDSGPGVAGHHEPEFEYVIEARAPEHPIWRGLPPRFMHAQDEVYGRLRGPAEGVHILATAFSGKTADGTQRHEPVVMTIAFGAGRVFHTTLGHATPALRCAGFQTLLERGTEWAATGAVTLPIPADFPSEQRTSLRD